MTNIEIGRTIIKTEIEGLNQLIELLGQGFDDAINKIMETTGKVIITGVGKPGHIGSKIAATLSSTGTSSFYMHPTEASHGDMGMIGDNDIVLMLSNSGASRELNDIISYCKRFDICLIGVTSEKESPLGKACNIMIPLPKAPEACPIGRAPTTSTTMLLALGDALALTLAQNKGFTEEVYKNWHPGGKLGASLVKISDVMHTLENFPLLSVENTVTEALPIMSSSSRGLRWGCVAIVNEEGHLIGSFTDGDIRRNLSPALPETKLGDVMNSKPKYIFNDELAVTALKAMQDLNLQYLFVLNHDYKPVGVIKMWDLLRLGVT